MDGATRLRTVRVDGSESDSQLRVPAVASTGRVWGTGRRGRGRERVRRGDDAYARACMFITPGKSGWVQALHRARRNDQAGVGGGRVGTVDTQVGSWPLVLDVVVGGEVAGPGLRPQERAQEGLGGNYTVQASEVSRREEHMP
jgi:hypothetical protein